jgi:DNA polymerase-3 subunit delta
MARATAARAPTSGGEALAALERDTLRAYYLLCGEETFLVDRALAHLQRRLLAPERPGGWRTVWGDERSDQLAGALEELISPPLFGGPQVLVLRRADALREQEQASVAAMLPHLGGGGCLILIAQAPDMRRQLFATCVRAGAAYRFPELADDRTTASWVARLARERGHEIVPAAVQELVDRTGRSLGALASEVEKLSLYVGSGARIEVTHVESLVTAARAREARELTDRLARRDVAGAAHALRRLLGDGEPPLRLLAFVAANLRRALHVAELAASGLSADDIARRLGLPPWLVARSSTSVRAAGLMQALLALRRLDLVLKSTRTAEAAFEATLLEIAGASGRRGA